MSGSSTLLCPLCHRPADALVNGVQFGRTERALIRNLNPAWGDVDGICTRCVAAIRESARRVRELDAKANTGGEFREYRRYYLSRRESGQWNYVKPEIAKWRQRRLLDRVSAQAERDGAKQWALFDSGETLIAQGAGGSL